jgi:hypothetical protein
MYFFPGKHYFVIKRPEAVTRRKQHVRQARLNEAPLLPPRSFARLTPRVLL